MSICRIGINRYRLLKYARRFAEAVLLDQQLYKRNQRARIMRRALSRGAQVFFRNYRFSKGLRGNADLKVGGRMVGIMSEDLGIEIDCGLEITVAEQLGCQL